jgi:hypothetical protein
MFVATLAANTYQCIYNFDLHFRDFWHRRRQQFRNGPRDRKQRIGIYVPTSD